jgi:bifunctional DNA-binding transcriptional regulator/antitoxin component of YhaV-PrlF toxin-antitoxin module
MTAGSQPTRIVRPIHGGQVTIPAEFRKALGIDSESLLELTLTHGEVRIRLVGAPHLEQGSTWLRDAYEAFAPIREELSEKYSEAEIDDAIDQAVRSVRENHASRGL